MRKVIFTLFILSMFINGGLLMARNIPQQIEKMIEQGQYSKAREALRAAAEKPGIPYTSKRELLFESERLRRVPLDFRLTREDVLKEIQTSIPGASMKDVDKWTQDGTLESRLINGKQLYYSRAVGNLFRLNKKAAALRKPSISKDTNKPKAEKTEETFPIRDMCLLARKALDASKTSGKSYVLPIRYHIDYTLTVKPDEVPDGEVIRCWLPYPGKVPTQSDIVLLSTFPKQNIIAPANYEQRSVYLEERAKKGQATQFKISFEYTAWSFVQKIDPDKIQPYNKDGEIYKKYTSQRPTQLEFTPEIIAKAKEICGDETNPYLKAKKIFKWVEGNIQWSGAIEYSLVPNLAQRALNRGTGDCGMQGLLFIALCRSQGIPARWQSGWQTKPGHYNLHDWTQFYVEPYGWLYCDPSNGLLKSDDEEVKWFNFGNFDRYRLIINIDYSQDLYPLKIYFRSEPVDFQRGEVEWRGGNLYFNQWTYKMNIKYIPVTNKES